MRFHVMLDFETLSTKPTAACMSLGIVRFSREEILETEHLFFDLKEQCERRIVDGATLVWWNSQGEAARTVFEKAGNHGILMREALSTISQVYQRNDLVWGNGGNFDPVIAESMYIKAGLEVPWKFWNVRCYRTLKSLYPHIEKNTEKPMVKHDALEDALFQAKSVQAFLMEHPELDT